MGVVVWLGLAGVGGRERPRGGNGAAGVAARVAAGRERRGAELHI